MRAFVRDKLQLPFTEVGEGWLIFDLPEADIGAHPLREPGQPASGTHEVSFYCDDIRGTVETLKERGVVFDQGISDAGYGLVTSFTMPGGVKVDLYEPKYVKKASRVKAPKASGKSRRRGSRRPVASRRIAGRRR